MTEHYSVLGLSSYLIVMLLGGMLRTGYIPEALRKRQILLPGAAIAFALYVVQSFLPFPGVFKILQWVLSITFVFCFSAFMITLEERLSVFPLVNRLADMTLEIYMVQYLVIEPFSTERFPVGILLCLISIFAAADCLHKFALFAQERLKA